jgi:hypothetical protein
VKLLLDDWDSERDQIRPRKIKRAASRGSGTAFRQPEITEQRVLRSECSLSVMDSRTLKDALQRFGLVRWS